MSFEIHYPITRAIRWRWVGPLSFLGAFIAIVLLTVLNVALVGYETINVFSSDFRATQSMWYHQFTPFQKPKPGSLCDPHLFNVGDRLTTNYTIFEWSIQSVESPNAASSGVAYRGSPLTACDVSTIYLNGDLLRYSIDFSVVMSCKDKETFGVTATTSFTMSSLPGVMENVLGVAKIANLGFAVDVRAGIVDQIIRSASEDVGRRAQVASLVSDGSSPIIFSYAATFDTHCPAIKSSSACGTQRPSITFAGAASVTRNGTLLQDVTDSIASKSQVIDDSTEAPLLNLVQSVYAAARIDVGIDTPNNFILHKEALPLILNKTFPVTAFTPATVPEGLYSDLYNQWENGYPSTNMSLYLPLQAPGPAEIQIPYLCRFQRRKSAGSLIVSVLVAVLSMFSSGWGIYMVVLAMLAKRSPLSNTCEGHLQDSYQDLEAESPEKYV